MGEITRRQAVIVTLAVPVLLGGAFAAGLLEQKVYDKDYNHGEHASGENHPSKAVNDAFNPKYVMLLYLDIEDNAGGALRMRATTLQFPVVSYVNGDNRLNTWERNKYRIANWINCLNKPEFPNSSPNPNPMQDPSITCHWPSGDRRYVKKDGLGSFVFNQPHHFVIYIQNQNIEYHKEDPIWFGKLLGEMENGKAKRAEKNRSFFGARVITPSTAVGDRRRLLIAGYNSKKLIYAKNFYQGWRFFGGYYDLGDCKHAYSLNINAELPATTLLGGASVQVPIIVDPDTGNMGGGDPPRD